MNRVVLIKIIEDIVKLHLQNNLTIEEFTKVIDKHKGISINDDKIVYEEAKFTSFLFQNIPYYKILITFINIIANLHRLEVNPEQKCIISLVEGYLSELTPTLNNRITTEYYAHIMELLFIFYQERSFENHNIADKLIKNAIAPDILTSMDTANQIKYHQETIEAFQIKEITLREKISRSNYNHKNRLDNRIIKMLTKYYNEPLYQEFLTSLNTFLERNAGKVADFYFIKDDLNYYLNSFFKRIIEEWLNPPCTDSQQLTLKLY